LRFNITLLSGNVYDGLVFNAHNVGFMSSYFAAEKAVGIQPIQILWTTILSTWFPALGEKAHKIAYKALGSPDKKEPDAILRKVQYVWAKPSGKFQEHEMFVAQCKSWVLGNVWGGGYRNKGPSLQVEGLKNNIIFEANIRAIGSWPG
jgi:hypothetical protein